MMDIFDVINKLCLSRKLAFCYKYQEVFQSLMFKQYNMPKTKFVA